LTGFAYSCEVTSPAGMILMLNSRTPVKAIKRALLPKGYLHNASSIYRQRGEKRERKGQKGRKRERERETDREPVANYAMLTVAYCTASKAHAHMRILAFSHFQKYTHIPMFLRYKHGALFV